MKAMKNSTHIEGYVYEHDLALKVTGKESKNPGTEFIAGTLSIATDEKCTNIVSVHFTYVTAVTSKGAANNTYTYLKNVIDGTVGNVMKNGKENAGKVRIDSAIGLNDFYTDRTGTVELVSAKRNEGGFVHGVPALSEDEKVRSTFEADMLISGVVHQDANDEKNLEERAIVKGAIFDYKGAFLPVEFIAKNPKAISYFESLGASSKSPIFTKVWGRQISATVTTTITEESAFGEDNVREVQSNRKEWVITGATKEPYAWDDESTITAAEVQKAIADREVYLGTVKQRYLEYKEAQKAPAANAGTTAGGFNF